MNKHINHISSLIPALRRKAELFRQMAEDADASKEGRSALAQSLREQAEELEGQAEELASSLEDIMA